MNKHPLPHHLLLQQHPAHWTIKGHAPKKTLIKQIEDYLKQQRLTLKQRSRPEIAKPSSASLTKIETLGHPHQCIGLVDDLPCPPPARDKRKKEECAYCDPLHTSHATHQWTKFCKRLFNEVLLVENILNRLILTLKYHKMYNMLRSSKMNYIN